MAKKHYASQCIVGIDEAGRGPLAGPVAVGICIIPRNFNKKLLSSIKGKDSKKLTELKREEWFGKLERWKKEGKLNFHAVLVSNSIIDKKGISFAIRTGIKMCLRKVKADCDTCEVLLDGGLKAPEEFKKQKTIIKGDEKEQVISLASIAAKVTRDRWMKKASKKFTIYKFEIHKGYGTVVHRKAIQDNGFSPLHRTSFCKAFKVYDHLQS